MFSLPPRALYLRVDEATSKGHELYLRYILLLLQTAPIALRGFIRRKVTDCNGNLADLIYVKKDVFKHNYREVFQLLFKDNRINTDIESWDVRLLCVVILVLFHSESAKLEAIECILDQLKDLSNYVESALLDNKTFETKWKSLHIAIIELIKGIDAKSEFECIRSINLCAPGSFFRNTALIRNLRMTSDVNKHVKLAIQNVHDYDKDKLVKLQNASLIPDEILRMDKNSIELYKRALIDGKEAVHTIRVMVVGHYGVGKTTLTKRLFGEGVDINQRESTNGIDVHVRRCKVSMDTGKWNIYDKDQNVESANNRLVKILKSSICDKKSIKAEGLEIKADIGESEDTSAGLMIQKLLKRENKSNETEEPAPKFVQEETNDKEEKFSLKSKDEDILNDIKKLIEEQQHSAVDSNTADVSVWDFAGQYVFYATHQVFLSRRAVYLLVTDISKRLDDIVQDDDCYSDSKGPKKWTILEFVNFWMNSIHELCSTSGDKGPPVLLVGTCADKLDSERKSKAIVDFFFTLRSSLLDKATSCHLIEKDFPLDNSIVDSNIELLRKQIVNTASEQDYWGELIPAKWITLENIILGLKDNGLKVLLKDRLQDLNKTLPVPIETEEELELFLRFHHDSGNILYYSDDKLSNSIVLDPQWLIDAFKSLITDKEFYKEKLDILRMWNHFDQSAILTVKLVDLIWEKKENSEFHKHRDLLLDYLEKLGFIAIPRQSADDTELADSYFAPCVLKEPPQQDKLSSKDIKNRRSTSKMCFTTASGFLPTAVFNKLLAACISKWPLSKKNKEYLIYCGCGLFDLKDNHTLYVYFFDHVIQIWVTRMSTEGLEPDFSLCPEVHDFVSDFLQNRLRLLSGIEVFVKCHTSEPYSNDNMFPIDEIAEKPEVVCNCAPEPHVLRTKELTKYWINTKFDHELNIPTDKEINRIAQHIGKEYESLGLELGLFQTAIDQIKDKSPGIVDSMRRMLLKWKEDEGDKATLDVLVEAMKAVRIDAQTVLERAGITK